MSAGDQSEPAGRAARLRALLENSEVLIREARELRERSRNIRYENTEFREFLRESLLNVLSKRDARSDG